MTMLRRLRAWARQYTQDDRYTPVGVVFHWTMAALVLFQLGWGFYTDVLMPGGSKLQAYQVHSAAGLAVLVLAFFRAAWRFAVPGPVNDADRLGWQTTLAHVTHFLFYACFVLLPISGWIMWSAIAPPGPLYVAGIIPWPDIPLHNLPIEQRQTWLGVAERVHHWLIWLLLVLVPAHAGAALKHHFWDRHDVLRGMLPEIPDWEDPQQGSTHRPQGPPTLRESEAG